MLSTWVNSALAGSQTESESDEDIMLPEGYVTPYGSQDDATISAPPLGKDNTNELVSAATRFIEAISDAEITDPEVHESISEAVDYILAFIDALLSKILAPGDHVNCIVELLSPPLIVRLFNLRAVFRELAAEEAYPRRTDITIVSWADELLVKLCACILHLATDGAMQDTNKVCGIQSIKKLQENEARKSATQLPATFAELQGALLSKHVSPATSRMALILLYGVYVLRTWYLQPPWEAPPSELASNMPKQVAKYITNETSPVNIYPSVLTEYAMTVGLYTHCNSSTSIRTPFAPHCEHILLDLVDAIINYSSTNAVCLGALKMILNDLGSMQWFWGRWGDGSTSIASTALRLTRSWILNSELDHGKYGPTRFGALYSAAPCSFQVILHLVEPSAPGGSPSLGDSSTGRTIINEVCRAYTLLARNREPGDQYECVLTEACKRLCPYVLSLDEYNDVDTVRTLVIELAVVVGPGVLRAAFGDAAAVEFRWSNRGLIEQVIQTVAGMINDAPDETGGATPQALKLGHLLDFLMVLLHANTCAASAVIFSTTFIPTLITWGAKRPAFEANLRTSTLLILGFLYSQFRVCCSVLTKRFPEFDLDGFIGTVLDGGDGSLLETGALARYIISTEEDRVLDDPVAVLEIWSRIQTTLLLTFQRRFMGDEGVIAAAVSGTLCAGLVSILNSAGKQTRVMILASPWTQTLRVELQRALEGTDVDDYSLGLRRQLKDVGTAVVQMIEGNPKPELDDSVRLVYVDTGGRLEIVPLLFC